MESMTVIRSLGSARLRVNKAIPVRIRRIRGKFVADVKEALGLILESQHRSRRQAMEQLKRGIVLQYLRIRNKRHSFYRELRANYRKFVTEVRAH